MDSPKDIVISFLNTLFSRYPGQGSPLLEIRAIKPGQPARSSFYPIPIAYDSFDYEVLKGLNDQKYNICFGINPRPPSKAKKQIDIRDITSLWIDLDCKDGQSERVGLLQRVKEFPLTPNYIIDSGNGYHCYWILDPPIINITEFERPSVRQILQGLADALGGDKQVFNLDRVMRLPGTKNYKDPFVPRECKVLNSQSEQFYTLNEFNGIKDAEYANPSYDTHLSLGLKEIIVPDSNPESAIKAAKKLELSSRIKNMIVTGDSSLKKSGDRTDSGRDQSIITALVASGYNYPTIKSIFYNRYLGCTKRMMNRGEHQLKHEVSRAIKYLSEDKRSFSPQVKAICVIKETDMSSEKKLKAISQYIVSDLFKNEICVGTAYKNIASKTYYFFEESNKFLMDIEGDDFRCFLKSRYELPEKDFDEVLSWVKKHIWEDGQECEIHQFAFYNTERNLLYVYNNDNRIYRLDGSSCKLVDNGFEGVLFKYNFNYSKIQPSKIDGLSYFRDGFDWARFKSSDSLLNEFLVEGASFALEEKHNLTAEEQQYLLTIYFYSLFFESVMQEKPILCFQGIKSSGKSYIATAIGKILFGRCFYPKHLPESPRDFKVLLSENYYIVFDNLDSSIKQYLDLFCAAATGAEISERKLYTDREEIKIKPRVFMVITSRDPKFKRDDFVDRLLLFNTEKVKEPISRTVLYNNIYGHSDSLWAEILLNLNSIVRLLGDKLAWNPPGQFRIADWELFGKKVHSGSKLDYFVLLLEKMNREKSRFELEDDPMYILLRHRLYSDHEDILEKTSEDIFILLSDLAERLKLKSFAYRYKSPRSLGKRLSNIREELTNEFDIEVQDCRSRVRKYSIRAKSVAGGECGENAIDILKSL